LKGQKGIRYCVLPYMHIAHQTLTAKLNV